MKSFIVNYIIINYLLCERTYTEMTNVIISGRLSHSSDSESVFATLKILLNKLLIIFISCDFSPQLPQHDISNIVLMICRFK